MPSDDTAFATHVREILDADPGIAAAAFQSRLRGLYPLVLVRERDLAYEQPLWYVYRDGRWLPPTNEPWWATVTRSSVWVDRNGWVLRADPQSRGLLGIPAHPTRRYHFTEFVAPGTLEDAVRLKALIDEGHAFHGTILVRPIDGHLLAVDIRAEAIDGVVEAKVRLSERIPIPVGGRSEAPPRALDTEPEGDGAFRRYAERTLAADPGLSPEQLAIRLRRLYPHAEVVATDGRWRVRRGGPPARDHGWWTAEDLPRVRYDAQGLVLDANDPARALLGADLVGRHWHEMVTTGSAGEIEPMLALIRDAGTLVSRFRMPAASGELVEFDSWSQAEPDGITFVTVMRPLA